MWKLILFIGKNKDKADWGFATFGGRESPFKGIPFEKIDVAKEIATQDIKERISLCGGKKHLQGAQIVWVPENAKILF